MVLGNIAWPMQFTIHRLLQTTIVGPLQSTKAKHTLLKQTFHPESTSYVASSNSRFVEVANNKYNNVRIKAP
jgi:hypothetical protein